MSESINVREKREKREQRANKEACREKVGRLKQSMGVDPALPDTGARQPRCPDGYSKRNWTREFTKILIHPTQVRAVS